MNERIKKTFELWKEIKESKEFRSLLKSQGSVAYTFVAQFDEAIELAEKLGRLDGLTAEMFTGKINMTGPNRTRKMNDMIVEMRTEVQTNRFGGALTDDTINMWRKEGKSIEEIAKLLRG